MSLNCTKLLSTSIVEIFDLKCDSTINHRNAEGASETNDIVVNRTGVFRKVDQTGIHLVDPSRIVIFRENEAYSTEHPANGGNEATIFTFSRHTLRDAIGHLDRRTEKNPLHDRLSSAPVNSTIMLHVRVLTKMIREKYDDDCLFQELALRFLHLSLGACQSKIPAQRISGPSKVNLVLDAQEILGKRYIEPITIIDLASEIQTSPFQLCRQFRKLTGTTIHQYLNTLRMASALDRLGDYQRNLQTLALDLGYSSHSHFSSTFKSYFGFSPSYYAKFCRKPRTRKNLKVMFKNI